MICAFCLADNVTWKGPMSNLTHTECSSCGRTNCEQHEPTPETDDDGLITVHPPQGNHTISDD